MNSLKKNLYLNVGYQLFSAFIPLILTPYVSRTIGAEGAGIYSYVSSIATFFSLFGMLGISNYGNRAIARIGNNKKERSEVFWSIWAIQFVMSTLVCLIYVLYCALAVERYHALAYIHLITVACSCFDINWFFWGSENFQTTILRNIIVKLLNLSLIFIFVKDSSDLILYTVIMVCGALLNCMFLWPFLKKNILFLKPSLSQIKQHIKPIIILFFPVLAISTYKILDKIMLGMLSSAEQTGFYEYSERIVGLPVTFITAVGTVMLPRLSVILDQKDMTQAKEIMHKTLEIIMCLTIAIQVGILSVANDLVLCFLGDGFAESRSVLMTLSFSIPFQGWANILRTQYLIPMGKDTIYVKSTFMGAITNFVLNLLLIPHLNAIGAALGTVFAELAVALYQSIKVRKELPLFGYFKAILFYMFPAISMLVAINIFDYCFELSPWVGLIIKVFIGGLIYVGISVLCLKKRYVKLFFRKR